MLRKAMWITGCLVALAGCAAAPGAPPPTGLPWRDQAFGYDAALVSVTREDLFRLDAGLAAKLDDPRVARFTAQGRLEHLVALVFGPEARDFSYTGGHTTIAAETWRRKRGDCLSLTVLTYALARALQLPARMQEVRVPVAFDRRGGVDFLNRHVNVLIRNNATLYLMNGSRRSGDLIIDFEPQTGSWREGVALSDDGILARFYNNLGAEFLALGNPAAAYAHFKAAILADAGYSPSYGNLAQLYQRRGLLRDAEQLLLYAIALNDDSDIPLHSMHQLLVSQGRQSEALQYAGILRSRQDKDPYYWIGVGVDYLKREDSRNAVRALERAQALTSGFQEVHRYLAIAYWRAGEQARARDQLSLLASLQVEDAGVAALSRKFSKSPH